MQTVSVSTSAAGGDPHNGSIAIVVSKGLGVQCNSEDYANFDCLTGCFEGVIELPE